MRVYAAFCLVLSVLQLCAEPAATVRIVKKSYRTYPFSDPNPIPQAGRIYPYYRFDGYTDLGTQREWKVIELENNYLCVSILPEIGGKIWSAVEKSTGRSFIYDNKVVKFRDVAMRGPWTSGGIEANYGIIGHTPNCATPVDYLTRTNADGSASAFIGVLDLLTRTWWRIEINLARDAACFSTRSVWFNTSGIEQPYYTWMNTGIKAAGDLELVFPGTHYIGHEGDPAPWPMHPGNGKNLSFYEQNDFGSYKSYHVLGSYADFFGAFWHRDNFGMTRWSLRDDKVGKKAWIWGLSRQGMIWERLLTDDDGQYVEMQSGRLFNQSTAGSTRTPFKHRGFAPGAVDTWTEYWSPVKGTKGLVDASACGSLNVTCGDEVEIHFCATRAMDDRIEVFDGDRRIYNARLALKPMETWSGSINAGIPKERLRVRFGSGLVDWSGARDSLSRPLKSPDNFNWEAVYGLWLKGKEAIRQRDYDDAEAFLRACLKKDPHYVPALADLAMLRYRAMDDAGAFDQAKHALAVDTYDGAANYYYALAGLALGKVNDAKDGFDIAALSPEYRVAAWTGHARLRLSENDPGGAEAYANRSLTAEPMNIEALQLLAVCARVAKDPVRATKAVGRLLGIDPLSHFARAEEFLATGKKAQASALVEGIRNEMPCETFLEMAAWYRGLGRAGDALRLLELAEPNAEILYWKAYLQNGLRKGNARQALKDADRASPWLVFPFRPESQAVFDWAAGQSRSWKPRYYLALLAWSRGDQDRALEHLDACGAEPDYPPFYAARAKLNRSRDGSLVDLKRAASLEPGEWRYGKLLAERLIEDNEIGAALEITGRHFGASPSNHIIALLHARTLLLDRRYAEASRVLGSITVLPSEGQADARGVYREAELMLAASEMRVGKIERALAHVAAAREWPERLGAGKPYPNEVDERFEDWLTGECFLRQGKAGEAQALFERFVEVERATGGARGLMAALALKNLGKQDQADQHFKTWAESGKNADLIGWARRVFAGERVPWAGSQPSSLELRVLTEAFGPA